MRIGECYWHFSEADRCGHDGNEIRSIRLKGTRLEKSKKIELAKIEKIKNTLKEHFNKIVKSFPTIDDLPEFYKELIKATLDYKTLKKSLAAINWAKNKILFFYDKYRQHIKRTKDLRSINKYRRDFYGRVSSVIRQIKLNLKFIEEARKIMKEYPEFYKTNVRYNTVLHDKNSVEEVFDFFMNELNKTTKFQDLSLGNFFI